MHTDRLGQLSALACGYGAYLALDTAEPDRHGVWLFVALCTSALLMFDVVSILGYASENAWVLFVATANWLGAYGTIVLFDMYQRNGGGNLVLVFVATLYVLLYLATPMAVALICMVYTAHNVLVDELKFARDVV